MFKTHHKLDLSSVLDQFVVYKTCKHEFQKSKISIAVLWLFHRTQFSALLFNVIGACVCACSQCAAGAL